MVADGQSQNYLQSYRIQHASSSRLPVKNHATSGVLLVLTVEMSFLRWSAETLDDHFLYRFFSLATVYF